jgi:hypothetical protein
VPDHHISPKREKIQAATSVQPWCFRTEAQSWERLESPIMFADGAASKSQTEGANRSLFAEICLTHLSVGPDLLGRTRYDRST